MTRTTTSGALADVITSR